MKKRSKSSPTQHSFLSRVRSLNARLSQRVAVHAQRTRSFEKLEQRHMLSADGLLPLEFFDSANYTQVAGIVGPVATTQSEPVFSFDSANYTQVMGLHANDVSSPSEFWQEMLDTSNYTQSAGLSAPSVDNSDDSDDATDPAPGDDYGVGDAIAAAEDFYAQAELAVQGSPDASPLFAVTETEDEFRNFVFTEETPYAVSPSGQISISSTTEIGRQTILDTELYRAQRSAGENREFVKKSYADNPLFERQWHLLNVGQEVGQPDFQVINGVAGEDINVVPVWDLGYTGEGVTVAVVDDGVQLLHPDLQPNINVPLSYDAIDGGIGTGANPDFFFNDAHGTAVAGLIGAVDNTIGGIGVAPGVDLAAIRLVAFGQTDEATIAALRHEWNTGEIDIWNHSWGPADIRVASGPTADQLLALRDGFFLGRPDDNGNPLGNIHVWAGGNGGGSPFVNQGFYDYSTFDGWVSSRYTIGVTGFDHDGLYNNIDGTVQGFAEGGPTILVAAPTGSSPLDIGLDTGIGSGIATTDLTDDFGYNQEPDVITGQELDQDYWPDDDYTTQFGGTSAATPIVAGVIALMLDANPNLSYRDVQEILVRSARQVAQDEIPDVGPDVFTGVNSWVANPDKFFVDPDPLELGPADPLLALYSPEVRPEHFLFSGIYQPADPDVFTTGAGYTVSQGLGAYSEWIGYGHGAVDAELAVLMAEQWHTLEENKAPELTFTTFNIGGFPFIGPGAVATDVPALEFDEDGEFELVGTGMPVPGGIGGGGQEDYWNEYFAEEPAEEPPTNTRGLPYDSLFVPDSNAMVIEWVEFKGDFVGNWDDVRLSLVSPNGTHSDFINYRNAIGVPGTNAAIGMQPENWPILGGPSGANTLAGVGTWSFNTNRSFGERSDAAVIFDPVTGNPYVIEDPLTGDAIGLVEREWQLHFENWSGGAVTVGNTEMVWHGTPIDPNSQRIQGVVGVDDNRDGIFNFDRWQQEIIDQDGDVDTIRHGEITRSLDPNVEDFAENVVVSIRRASDNFVVDRFLTGHDGNYYFDVLPDTYIIGIEAPDGYTTLDDQNAPDGFLPKYLSEWVITPDHFTVWNREREDIAVDPTFDPSLDYDVPIDPNTGAPVSFLILDADEDSPTFNEMIPTQYHVSGVNFLLDPEDVQVGQVELSGVIYADNNGDGILDPADQVQPGIRVYVDTNLNNAFDGADPWVVSDANGEYSLSVDAPFSMAYQVGVAPPFGWTPTNPETGLAGNFVLGPNEMMDGIDFLIAPPGVDTGGGGDPGGGDPGGGDPLTGTISGTVFSDTDGDGSFDVTESGQAGYRVYLDSNFNATLDGNEMTAITNGNGAYFFSDVPVGTYVVRLDDTPGFEQTFPGGGAGIVENLSAGEIVTGQLFGVQQIAASGTGTISGAVFLDGNGDGVRQGSENGIPGFQVYVDVNGDNQFSLSDGDLPASMNLSGGFVFNNAPAGFHTIRIETVSGYTQTAPIGDEFTVNLPASGSVSNLEFGVEAGVAGTPGTISGTVYLDGNGNGVREGSEQGIVGFNVYIDANNDSSFNPLDGDIEAVASAGGNFSFANVPTGIHVIRVEGVAGYTITDPATGGGKVVNVTSGASQTDLLFGVTPQGEAEFDYGDLPFAPTRLAESGPRHLVVPGHSLGATIDAEGDGQPNATATGDDAVSDDEDGVTLLGDGTLLTGQDATFSVIVNGIGMYVNAWLDLNGDGTFNNDDEWIVRDEDVNPGVHEFTYSVPMSMNIDNGPVAMRWRLGTLTSAGHDYRGDDIIGEVEDYLVQINPASQNVIDDPVPGDYDGNGFVDQTDRLVWRASFGTTNSAADGNGDGIVDGADYTVWQDNLGAGNPPAAAMLALGAGFGEGGSGESSGAATKSRYEPFGVNDPREYVAPTPSDQNAVASPTSIDSGSQQDSAPADAGGPVNFESPDAVDLYFDQLSEEQGQSIDDTFDLAEMESVAEDAVETAFGLDFDLLQ